MHVRTHVRTQRFCPRPGRRRRGTDLWGDPVDDLGDVHSACRLSPASLTCRGTEKGGHQPDPGTAPVPGSPRLPSLWGEGDVASQTMSC